jgi:predicted amidophosphoribosyltransferase
MATAEEKPPLEIHPSEIKGSWDTGYVLDRHTISSTMIGYNEFGHPEFDTQRSPLGELVYRLKYKSHKSAIASIVETIVSFVQGRAIQADVIVPMPPSKLQRPYQPVIEIASELSKVLKIALDTTSLKKTKTTPQMKDIGDYSERVAALDTAFTVGNDLEGKRVLLIDDLLQSGATMNVVAKALREQGRAKAVYAIALTRTRS